MITETIATEGAVARPAAAATFRLLSYLVVLFLASAGLQQHSEAHIGDFDETWRERAKLAKARAHDAYNPNPISVANSFNQAVHEAMDSNITRRGLAQLMGRTRKKKAAAGGPCMATNPIDRCWRCRANWIRHRKKLATCAKGFGRHTTGGAAGEFYTVTDPSDNDLVNPKKGTLRWGALQDKPLWIVFARDMIIRLSEELLVNSNKTIDGRGANVRIAGGASLTIQYVHNVIIHGLHIHDIKSGGGGLIRDSPSHFGLRTRSDGDGISVFGATNIWIDHVSMSNCDDGIIDVIMASTAVTISNSHFTNHNEVSLFGASDAYSDDAIMQITVAFNHYGRGLIQRMPRARWGFVHVVNNDYTHWEMYAVGGSQHPTILSQGNRYIAPDNPFAKQVTKRDYAPEAVWSQWVWKSQGDILMNGAFFVASGGGASATANRGFSNKDLIKAKPGTFVRRLTRYSGVVDCVAGKPC